MPTLEQVLTATMIDTAARGVGFSLDRVPPGSAIDSPTPEPSEVDVAARAIWGWSQDPSQPRRLRDITLQSRTMGMAVTVAKHIEFGDPRITFSGAAAPVELPLQPAFHCVSYVLPRGQISANATDLWRLPAETDASIMHVFAFQQVGGAMVPLTLAEIDALGPDFMPWPPAVRAAQRMILGESAAVVTLARPRVLVCISVTCCRELNDCEPGSILGGARIYPHVMVLANVSSERIEATIHVRRPASTMTHGDPEMTPEIQPLFVTDTNEPTTFPTPYWSDIFDYYHTQPDRAFIGRPAGQHGPEPREPGEVCFVDPGAPARRIEGAVMWNSGFWGAARKPRTIVKQARQGEFDNIHLAPRMQLTVNVPNRPDSPVKLTDIAMAPICVHDCLHTHMRWGFAGDSDNPAMLGFDDSGTPHAKDGAPHVPPDQYVFVRMDSRRSFRYRAVSRRTNPAGQWTCFMHHGMFYAVGIWPAILPSLEMTAARELVDTRTYGRDEPFTSATNFPSATTSWAGFYWRVRWGGRAVSTTEQEVHERLDILDLERCMR